MSSSLLLACDFCGLGILAFVELIDQDGRDDKRPDCDLKDEGIDPQEVPAVPQRCDDQRAQDRPEDGPFSSHEAGPAYDRCSNGIQLVALSRCRDSVG